jgi:hypothetical protein
LLLGESVRAEFLRPSILSWSTNQEPTMSCKIERVVSDEHLVVLLMSGRITGEEVDVFRRVLDHEADPPAIDLGSVLLVDRAAVKLLAQSEANGSELRNCPLYVREWVTRERRGTTGRVSPDVPEGTEDIEDA